MSETFINHSMILQELTINIQMVISVVTPCHSHQKMESQNFMLFGILLDTNFPDMLHFHSQMRIGPETDRGLRNLFKDIHLAHLSMLMMSPISTQTTGPMKAMKSHECSFTTELSLIILSQPDTLINAKCLPRRELLLLDTDLQI